MNCSKWNVTFQPFISKVIYGCYLLNEIVTNLESSDFDHFLSNNVEPKQGFSEFLKNNTDPILINKIRDDRIYCGKQITSQADTFEGWRVIEVHISKIKKCCSNEPTD